MDGRRSGARRTAWNTVARKGQSDARSAEMPRCRKGGNLDPSIHPQPSKEQMSPLEGLTVTIIHSNERTSVGIRFFQPEVRFG
jgi:hypothetical protein